VIVVFVLGVLALVPGRPVAGRAATSSQHGAFDRSASGTEFEAEVSEGLKINPRSWSYLDRVVGSAGSHDVPWQILWGLIHAESSFDASQKNLGGDVVGIAQIRLSQHPEITAAEANNPAKAIEFAAHYLDERFDRYHDWQLAVLSYLDPRSADAIFFSPHDGYEQPPIFSNTYVARVFGYAARLGFSPAS